MRINARLADDEARLLTELRARTGQTVSEVVREALRRYFRELFSEQARPRNVLVDAGFVGCAEADPDLSTAHEDSLREGLTEKHADR